MVFHLRDIPLFILSDSSNGTRFGKLYDITSDIPKDTPNHIPL